MTDNTTAQQRSNRRRARRMIRRVLSPIAVIFATLYFIIDLLFLSMLRPIAARLTALDVFTRLTAWIRSLGPYSALALFLVPLIILEPVKPVAAYLVALGHFKSGIAVLVIGEILKVMIVERLFHLSRDKLMTIATFAWCYNYIMGWFNYFQSFPAWQTLMRRFEKAKAMAREAIKTIKYWTRW